MDFNVIELSKDRLINYFFKSKTHRHLFFQGLEENLRETQATAQRLETHLKQKEKLYEDKIKVKLKNSLLLFDKNKMSSIFICFRVTPAVEPSTLWLFKLGPVLSRTYVTL